MENLVSDAVTPSTETTVEKDSLDREPQQDQVQDRLHIDREMIEESVEPKKEIINERDGWRKDYSEMVDTDEEEGGGGNEEDEDEDWEEQNCVSDYERHFMPSL